MALPTLTNEQRLENLEKAMAARSANAKLREALKTHQILFKDLLEREDAQRLRVRYVLESMEGVGQSKATTILRRCSISENRRVRGLGRKQKESLISEVEKYGY